MPPADIYIEQPDENFIFRILICGKDKTKKSWWLYNCAAAGLNVIVLDGDGGSSSNIIRQVDKEYRSRIHIIDVSDSRTDFVFHSVLNNFLAGKDFIYDEQSKAISFNANNCDLTHSHYVFRPSLFNHDVMLGVDSWTALAESTRFQTAKKEGIDLTKGEKVERNIYQIDGLVLDHHLKRLDGLKCHVCIVSHEGVWEKRVTNKATGREEVLFTRTVPLSSSGPHGSKLGKYFSDVFYFELVGENVYIKAGPHADRPGGSRTIAPKDYRWEALQFLDLCKTVNIPLKIRQSTPGITWYAPGVTPEFGNKAVANTALGQAVKELVENKIAATPTVSSSPFGRKTS